MTNIFDDYKKQKDFLVCVDSDGCAIDTMTIKHEKCFGPCMVEEWNLEQWEEDILNRWNEVNLYTITRGINRFQGLAKALEEVNEKYTKIEDIDKLLNWVSGAKELSTRALENEMKQNPSCIFEKAISWSNKVNESINNLTFEEKQPFKEVKESLAYIHQFADIAIVSSANLQAVEEEWTEHGLLDYVDIVLAQEAGTKSICIEKLLKEGYDKDKVIMLGDAKGDLDAAEKNGVLYFPILVRNEDKSWKEFVEQGLKNVIDGKYRGTYQQEKIEQFLSNLS